MFTERDTFVLEGGAPCMQGSSVLSTYHHFGLGRNGRAMCLEPRDCP